jgi:hypothetical protein
MENNTPEVVAENEVLQAEVSTTAEATVETTENTVAETVILDEVDNAPTQSEGVEAESELQPELSPSL